MYSRLWDFSQSKALLEKKILYAFNKSSFCAEMNEYVPDFASWITLLITY